MKVYMKDNVFEAALKRITYIFNEFQNVIVSFSGGKDSTVVLELSLIVARQLNRLPLNVLWIDQEAEWQATVDYCRSVFYRDEVRPFWLQIPFKIFNCSSFKEDWLHAWEPGKEELWIHAKDPIAISENVYGVDRFSKIFPAVMEDVFKGGTYANIGGVRAAESLQRFGAVTSNFTYKDITWGKREKVGYTFYPLYDWEDKDIWTAIAKNGWEYNRLYDMMFQYGIPAKNMRCSNITHETAYRSLYFLQEFERATYDRLCNRLPGISTFSQMREEAAAIYDLPEVFSSWAEYRDYLLEKLIREDLRPVFRKRFDKQPGEDMAKGHVKEILLNDYTGTHNGYVVSKNNLKKKKDGGFYAEKY